MEKRRKRLWEAGWGCLMMACCFMLFCGCGGKEPSLILENGTALDLQEKESGEKDSGSGEKYNGSGAKDGGSSEEEAGKAASGSQGAADSEGARAGEQIYVQVSGAVKNPGVYRLPADSRVFMAVELAGGLSQEADEASLNQAEALSDGQQVYVYAQGEEGRIGEEREAASSSDGRINLNTATAQELMTLPGIGQSKADSIISYRESNGDFGAVEDLMKIEGIKEGVFSKIKDRVKI